MERKVKFTIILPPTAEGAALYLFCVCLLTFQAFHIIF